MLYFVSIIIILFSQIELYFYLFFQKRKKKYKKKPPKPKKPRPGQVHIATALDGTTLFCCPECNMAYPDKDMLEQVINL